MTILGIDPGLERIGIGVIRREGSRLIPVHYALIQTPRILLPDRLDVIHKALQEVIATHKPDTMATERLIFAVNKTTALDVSKALGVILLTASQTGLPWAEYTPPEVKLAVVGNGAAEKRQVAFMVTKLLGLKEAPKPDDVADALAIACCHALKTRVSGRKVAHIKSS